MDGTTKTIAIGGAVVGVALVGQWAYNRFVHPDSANDSVLTRMTGYVANNTVGRVLCDCGTSGVSVGFPVINASGQIVDGSRTENRVIALQRLCSEEFSSDNAGDVAVSHLSVESMNGNLQVACSNCSLFNIHHPGCGHSTIVTARSPRGKPCVYRGTDKLISFLTDEPNQVEGFRACIKHYKGYLERRAPSALELMRQRDFDGFQRVIAGINYSPMYTRSVSGGTVRDPLLRRRFDRLLSAGLAVRR